MEGGILPLVVDLIAVNPGTTQHSHASDKDRIDVMIAIEALTDMGAFLAEAHGPGPAWEEKRGLRRRTDAAGMGDFQDSLQCCLLW
jgi:hypothetical protein